MSTNEVSEKEIQIIEKISNVSGIIRPEGLLTWSQQQMLEKLDDPFSQQLIQIILEFEPTKRQWKKIIKKMSEQES